MKNKYRALLFDRIQENYADFIASLSSSDMINKAVEISAAQMVKESLMDSVDEQQAEWLLRFDNPMEIMRDKWIEENGMRMVPDEDFSHALWSVMNCQDTERLYLLAPGVEPTPGRDDPVTVREFMEQHPNASFDMVTPGGFVYLTPDRAKLLLAGQNIKGHHGSSEYATEIITDELLNQEVIDAKFSGKEWRICTADNQEMTQKPPSLDQGVTM
ncbi:hypothetical protein [Hydrogenoanaerobacterium sp.]|uniref:hypothetical protein n=1 Tax=Hydrogenoanaerobacterium sp. TaxID=2953763 RepID=UPI00289DE8BE|nr:hypothetical protein [Hydrogenoanaerobacterium sp.]